MKDNTITYKNEWKFWSLILLLAALMYAYPFYTTEYLSHSDTFFHMNRIEGIKESLLGGEFPVRIHGYQLNGYGTADGVMYPSLFLYFPAVLRILGVSVAVSWNIFWIFLTVFGIFTAFVGFTIWSQNLRKGAIAALFFHATEIGFFCVGHAVGDYPAFFAMPLVIGSILKILEDEQYAKYWPFFVVGFTIVFESHVITTILLSSLILGIIIINFRSLKNPIQRQAIIKATLFSAMLNIWFAVPFVYFFKTVAFHINHTPLYTSLHDVTSNLTELTISRFFLSAPLIVIVIAFLLNNNTRKNRGFLLSILAYILILFTLHENFPWQWIENNIPGGNFLPNFQFPLRFIVFPAIFVLYYIGSFFAEFIGNKTKYPTVVFAFFIYTISVFFQVNLPIYFGHNALKLGSQLEYKVMENLPSHSDEGIRLQEDYLYADVDFYKLRNDKGEFYSDKDYKSDAKIFDAKKQGTRLEFSYVAQNDTKAQVPLFYYEGYEARDEHGNKLTLSSGEHRFMEVDIKKGEGKVKIHYAGLAIFRIFDTVSLLTLIIFFIIVYRERRKLL